MRRILFGIFTGLLLAATASAVPSQLTIQGHLGNGGASVEGQHAVVFKLFDALTDGGLLWAETDTITVQSCLFTTIIGRNVPLPVSLFTGQTYWLETALDGTTLSPRLPLTATTYSFRSQRADTAEIALSGVQGTGAWQGDGTNVWRADGSVSIGPNSTEAPFVVQHNYSGTGPHNQIVMRNTAAGGGAMAFAIGADGTTTPSGIYGIGDETDMRLSINRTNGNVGIGTYTPTAKLDVIGSASASGGYFLGPDHTLVNDAPWYGLGYSELRLPSGSGYPAVQVGGYYGLNFQTAAGNVSLQANGNVGIGTTAPAEKLVVANGRALITGNNSDDTAKLLFINTASNHGWGWQALDSGGFELEEYGVSNGRLTFMPGGNVGINTYNPTSTLYVAGDFTATGTKCRAVAGTKYGTLYYNAMESGAAVFTTSGVATLQHGRAHVDLDPRWLAGVTVDDRHPLQVTSVVFHGPSGTWYVARGATSFDLIESTGADAEFFWTVQASQKGYEDRYLDQGGSSPAGSKGVAADTGGRP